MLQLWQVLFTLRCLCLFLRSTTAQHVGRESDTSSKLNGHFVEYQVVEEQPINTSVGSLLKSINFHETLDSTDLQSLDFGFLTLPPVDRRFFHLERRTGVIRTDVVIDRESVCSGQVSCPVEFDVTVRPLRIFQIVKVKIEILDLNDNRPSFPDLEITRQISEASDLESVVQLPAAHDPDSPSNGIVKYTLEFISSSPTLPMSPVPVHSGIVGDVAWGSVKKKMSRFGDKAVKREKRYLEVKDHLLFLEEILWSNGSRDHRSFVDHNHISHHHHSGIRWRRDHDVQSKEVARRGKGYRQKEEDNEDGDGPDDDDNDDDEEEEDDDDPFQGDQSTDQNQKFQLEVERRADGRSDVKLLLKHKLDREAEDRYKFVVWVEDGGETALTGSMSVEIVVLDANDNSPSFENATYEVKVPEDLEVGSALLKVRARDRDIGLNGMVIYDFSRHTQQEFGNLFGIRSDSGKIFLKDKLDYESSDVHLLTVLAEDKGPNPLPGEASVVIRVEDVNDNAPEISVRTLTSDGRAHVPENAQPGAFVAYVSVTDRDGSSEDEALLGGDDHGDMNGVQKKRRNMVECLLQQPHQFFSPRFTRSSEFKISTLVSFDREVSSIQTLTIVCKDSGTVASYPSSSSSSSSSNRLTSSVELIVQILDENDNRPTFGNPRYEFSLHENRAPYEALGKVLAIDPDLGANGQVTYTLKENSSNLIREKFQVRNTSDWTISSLFQVHSTMGLLESKVSFDREFHDEYSFIVVARDNGKPTRKSSEVEVIVRILDEDDEHPVFLKDKYDFRLEESSQRKSGDDESRAKNDGGDDHDDDDEVGDAIEDGLISVGFVQAVDKDSDSYNRFDYVMEVNDDVTADYFSVNATSGEINVLRPIDREFASEFNFFVAANPLPSFKRTSLVSRAFVSINVDDVNDNKPFFIFPPSDSNETIALSNMAPVGHVIARLKARDDDRGENATVSFRFQSNGNQGHLFEVNAASGEVRVRTDMTSINFREVILRFNAQDGGPFPLSSDSNDLRVIVSKDIPFHDPDSSQVDFGLFLFRDGITVVVTAMTLTFLLLSLCAVLAAIACFFKKRRPCLTMDEKKNMEDFLPLEKPIPVSGLQQQHQQQTPHRRRSISPQATNKNTSNGHVISYDVTNDDVTKSNVTSVYFDGASNYTDGNISQISAPDDNPSQSSNYGRERKKINWKSLDCFKEFEHVGRRCHEEEEDDDDDARRRGYDDDDSKKVVVFIKEDDAFKKRFYQVEDQKKIGHQHNPFKTMPNAVHSSIYAPSPDPINFYHHGNSRQSNSLVGQSPPFKVGHQVAGHPIKHRHHHGTVGSPNYRICSPLFDGSLVAHPLLAAIRHNESLAPFVSQSLSPPMAGHHVIWPKKKTDKIYATPFVLPPDMTPPSLGNGVMVTPRREWRSHDKALSWRRGDVSKGGDNSNDDDDTSDESNTPEVEVGRHVTSGDFMSVPDTKV